MVDDFYTFDIETINQSNKLVPYLICAYNGLLLMKIILNYYLNHLLNNYFLKLNQV